MPLEPPRLDDRSYNDILQEIRRRIPRYAPEWTDFNDSDPGMALAQLFAWMTEMTLFRLNKVPDLAYIKFLQLLGIERRPPEPARADLTFTPVTGFPEPVSVPQRSRVEGPADADGLPVVFETDEGLGLVRSSLASVQVYDGFDFQQLSDANADPTTPFHPLGRDPGEGSALYLGFEVPGQSPAPADIFPSRITFRVWLPEGGEDPTPVQCDEELAGVAPAELVWEYKPSESEDWRRLSLYGDRTLAFTRSGYIRLQGPSEVRPTKQGRGPVEAYWLRARLTRAGYGDKPPEIATIRPNTVSATNLVSVREEVLGDGNGQPRQSFSLRFNPVDAESFELKVQDESGELGRWTRVDDFLTSGSESLHFTLEATTGTVRFGDGVRGLIPPIGADVVAQHYRAGGGAAGNAKAGDIETLQAFIAGVDGVTNLRPAVGGRDEQPLEDAKLEAPARIRNQDRAVTAEDYQSMATAVGGVERAQAIPLLHPSFPGVDVPGAVTVLIVPKVKERPPTPSQELLRVVCERLNERRMLTSELFVSGPKFVEIQVEATVMLLPSVAFDDVTEQIVDELNKFFDSLTWDWGRDFYPTDVFGEIMKLRDKGVAAVGKLVVHKDGQRFDIATERVQLARNELPYSRTHNINPVPYVERG